MIRPRIRVVLPAAILLCLAVSAAAQTAVNEQAVRAAAAGKLSQAKASWWGFDPVEATASLQAAINSRVPRLIIDNVGKPWIVDPISLVSNQEIIFEPGVEVVAKKGSFHGANDSLFTVGEKENVILRGDPSWPALLRMHRSDYAAAPYSKAEWRMCLKLVGSRNVQVSNLILKESGGDGIYIGVGGSTRRCKDITIRNVVCDSNYRQGISVISVENLLIEDCELINTGGTAPAAGIDFEPNKPEEVLINCVMRNCVTRNNAGCGYALYIPPLKAASHPVSLRFENCRSMGDGAYAMALYTGNSPADAVLGSIDFVGCTFRGSVHAGLYFINKPADGCRVRLDRCSVTRTAARFTAESPIIFAARAAATDDIGGVEFTDCLIRDEVDRPPMCFEDLSGFVSVRDVTGSLTVERGGQRTEHELTPGLVQQWVPATPLKRLPRMTMAGIKLKPVKPFTTGEFGMPGVRCRSSLSYVVYAREGDEVKLRAGFQQVGNYGGTTMPVEVFQPDGEAVAAGAIPFQQEGEVAFTAPVTGLYRVTIKPGANYGYVASSSHPLNLSSAGGAAHLVYDAGELFFWVPEGTTEFALRMFGEGSGEGLKAELRDPSGALVEAADNIAATHQFDVVLDEPSRGEAWSIALSRPSNLHSEDNYLLILGIPPLAASVKDALLMPIR